MVCSLSPALAQPTAGPEVPEESAPPIELAVDATDLAHRVLQVRETLRLPPGPPRRLPLN